MGEGLRKCLKYTIVCINIPIVLLGAAAIALGVWIAVDEPSFIDVTKLSDIDKIDRAIVQIGAYVLLAGGVAAFVFGLLGCVAAYIENACLLGLKYVLGKLAVKYVLGKLAVYATVLITIIAAEVAAVVLAFVFREQWQNNFEEDMQDLIVSDFDGLPNSANTFTKAMNSLHQTFECCGLKKYDEFGASTNWNRTIDENTTMIIPPSCCRTYNSDDVYSCTQNATDENSFIAKGCKSSLDDMFDIYQGVIIGVGVAIIGVETYTRHSLFNTGRVGCVAFTSITVTGLISAVIRRLSMDRFLMIILALAMCGTMVGNKYEL